MPTKENTTILKLETISGVAVFVWLKIWDSSFITLTVNAFKYKQNF